MLRKPYLSTKTVIMRFPYYRPEMRLSPGILTLKEEILRCYRTQ